MTICWFCHNIILPAQGAPALAKLPKRGNVPFHSERIVCRTCGASYYSELTLDGWPSISPEEVERRFNCSSDARGKSLRSQVVASLKEYKHALEPNKPS